MCCANGSCWCLSFDLSASSGFNVALYFNSNLMPSWPWAFYTHQTKTHWFTIYYHLSSPLVFTFPLLSFPLMECVKIIETRRWGSTRWFLWRLQYNLRKKIVFTVTELQPVYPVQHICLLMESGLIRLTHNISPFSSLYLLSLLWLQWHLAFLLICLLCMCKRCAFVPKTTFVVLLSLHTPRPWAHLHLAS